MANRIARGIDVYISVSRPGSLSDEAAALFTDYMHSVHSLLRLTKELSRHEGLDVECSAFNEMESNYYVETKYVGDCTWETADDMDRIMGGEEQKEVEKLEPVPWVAPSKTKMQKEIEELLDS